MTYSNCPFVVTPKDRKMTKATYKWMRHAVRLVWREKKEAYNKMMDNVMVYGSGSMEV